MGLMDRLKGLVGGNRDKISEGVDKATDVADEKTGGSHSEQLQQVDEKAEEVLDKIDDEEE